MIGCGIGMFGKGCSSKCSGYCLYNVICNLIIGYCDGGCVLGYVEFFCNKSMCVIIIFVKWIIFN